MTTDLDRDFLRMETLLQVNRNAVALVLHNRTLADRDTTDRQRRAVLLTMREAFAKDPACVGIVNRARALGDVTRLATAEAQRGARQAETHYWPDHLRLVGVCSRCRQEIGGER